MEEENMNKKIGNRVNIYINYKLLKNVLLFEIFV